MTGAELVAEFLCRRGVRRVFGLCGGHIQPIWDAAARAGIEIIDVRHECAAVYMAHAQAELTGSPSVALVTAGPGLTNAVTGIANAHVARAPVIVISGRPPRPQAGMGALQDLAQTDVVRPLCRRVESVGHRRHILSRLDAVVRAAQGAGTPPGPAYIDFPTDLLREEVMQSDLHEAFFSAPSASTFAADSAAIGEAVQLIASARRAVVVSGRGARGAGAELRALLDAGGLAYLDTPESRGVVSASHPAAVPAARAKAMAEADVVVTVGRRLDFQLAYGSPAVFAPDARFIRAADTVDELADNRRGDVELLGSVPATLRQLLNAGGTPRAADDAWHTEIREHSQTRVERQRSQMRSAPDGPDGRMHPERLLAAVADIVDEHTIVVADGGDILSFARVGLDAETYLDPGALGCLGVGVPFATAAALTFPNRPVIAVIGDGSFGFTAMEIDTAVRRRANAVYVVANNESWAIERSDQLETYSGNLIGVDLPGCQYDELARALGAYAEHVDRASDLPSALSRAFENTPAVIDVAVTPDVRSPDFRNGLALVPDYQALAAWDRAERTLD